MKHIGIIDITTLGTTLCQLDLVSKCDGNHPEYTVHSLPLSLFLDELKNTTINWQRIGDLILKSADTLQLAGADLIIMPNKCVIRPQQHYSRPWDRLRGESSSKEFFSVTLRRVMWRATGMGKGGNVA